jgi:nucleotide-binding universal stress UspA family protein
MAMTYAALIVNVEAGAQSDARVRLAAELAGWFDARLIGLAAQPLAPPPAHDPGLAYTATLLTQEEERVRAMLATAERRFRAACPPGCAGRAEWRSFAEQPGRALALEARSADLLIVGTDGGTDIGEVLMQAGRPVLVVPAGITSLEARAVVIGWRDTPQARRAVADALPLLQRAERVLVLEVLGRGKQAAGAARAGAEECVGLLARHGIAARSEARPLQEPTVADEIIRAARACDAGLIVCGGYGHVRLREWAFGGVTRDMLTRCPLCCLMSH